MTLAAALLLAATAGTLAAAPQTSVPLALQTFDAAWSIIDTTYYDPSFRGIDWKAVRDELRPEAERARTPADLRATINKMMARLGESHFAVLAAFADESEGDDVSLDRSGAPGFDVRPYEGALLVRDVERTSPAWQAGLRPGDRILSISNVDTASLAARLPASMEPRIRQLEIWRAAMMRLRGPVGSRFIVTIQPARGGGSVTRTIERVDERGQTILLGNLPPMKLHVSSESVETASGAAAGVIGFNVWMAGADAPFAAAIDRFRAARGIVIDLRGNPGGLAGMIMGLSGHFFSERIALGTMRTRGSNLTFYANPRLSTPDGRTVPPFTGKVAILVDGLTGSASECFAGGMQSVGRARIFGETTMGQALPASFTRLPNGDTLLHAIADFETATGTRLEGRGVVPDERVPLTPASLAGGADPVLKAALAWIDRP